MLGFRRKLSSVVVDHNQMKPRGLEQAIEVNDTDGARIALDSRNELVRNACAQCHLALALICVPPRSAQIPIDGEIQHCSIVCRSPPLIAGEADSCAAFRRCG